MNKAERNEEKTSPGEMKENSAGDELTMITPEGFDFSLYVPSGKAHITNEEGKLPARMAKNRAFLCDLLVDIGARTGFFSVMMAKANPELEVIAIESDERDFNALEKNLEQLKARGQKVKYMRTGFDPREESESFFSEFSGELHKTRNLFFRIDKKGEEMDFLSRLKPLLQWNDQATILLKVYPGAGSQDRQNKKLFEFLTSIDFKLFGLDEEDYRYYPVNVAGNAGRLSSKYESSFFYVLCLPDSKALSVAFFAHDSILSGASRSLLDLLTGLSAQGVLCTAIVPSKGSLYQKMRDAGVAAFSPDLKPPLHAYWLWADLSVQSQENARKRAQQLFKWLEPSLYPEIKKLAPDIVYSQTVVSPWGAVFANQLGIPHVLSAREYGHLDHNLNFYFGVKESLQALYESSEIVFCVTEDVRKSLFRADEKGKTQVIYSGIQLDPEEIKPDASAGEARFDADWEKGIRIGAFGTILPGKGQEDIVRACIDLLNRGLKIRCYLVGFIANVQYHDHLKQLIESSGFTDSFIWQNFTNEPYLLMKEMDIIVSCARMEALGRTMIEANLLKIPVIYSDSAGFKEIYTNGVHGLGYVPGDPGMLAGKIMETMGNRKETRKRVEQAFAFVNEKLNRNSYTERVLKGFHEIAGKKPRRTNRQPLRDLLVSNGNHHRSLVAFPGQALFFFKTLFFHRTKQS